MAKRLLALGAADDDNTGDDLRVGGGKINANADELFAGAQWFSFISRTTPTAQPGSPTDGDCYIVPGSATGTDWAGQDGSIAIYSSTINDGAGGWIINAPTEGNAGWVADEDASVVYRASGWDSTAIGSGGGYRFSGAEINMNGVNASPADGSPIVFTTAANDSDSWFNAGEGGFEVPAGVTKVFVTGSIVLTTDEINTQLWVTLNGAQQATNGGDMEFGTVIVNDILSVTEGDIIKLVRGGNAATINGGATLTKFSIHAISGPLVAGGIAGREIAYISEVYADGTDAGSSVVGWQTRALNTLDSNTITGLSLAGSTITMPAGTYMVSGHAPGFRCGRHRVRLRNTTDSTTLRSGTNSFAIGTEADLSIAPISGVFTLAAEKDVTLEHYTQLVQTGDGLGIDNSTGEAEVYAQLVIEKIA